MKSRDSIVSILIRLTLLSSVGIPAEALAQIQTQPTEIISATPLTPFSERAGVWPSNTLAADILQSEATPLADSLNTVPGLVARQNGSPTVSIRGSAQSGRVLSLFDGVPLVFADGFGTPAALVADEILGEVRIFKGPASVFYGSDALAGAINYQPRLFDRPAARLGASYDGGQLGTNTVLGIAPYRWGDDNRHIVQVSALNSYDHGRYPFTSVSTGIQGRREHNESRTQRYTLLGRQRFKDFDVNERIIFTDDRGTLPGSLTFPDPITFKTRAALGSADIITRLSPQDDVALKLSSLWQSGEYESRTGESSKTVSTRHSVFVDYAHVFESMIVTRTFIDFADDTMENTFYEGKHHSKTSLDVGQLLEIPLASHWTAQAGTRWLTNFGKEFNSVGLFHNSDEQSFWATYAEGFRQPSLNDRFAHSAFSEPNPGLKPETARQVEFGYEHKPEQNRRTYKKGLSWGGALYGLEYADFFDREILASGKSRKVNRSEAYSYGGELAVGYSGGTWTVSAIYNHLQGKIRSTDEPLPLSPRHQLTVSATQHLGPFVIELKDTFWSRFYDRDLSGALRPLGSWNTVDLNVRTIGFTAWEIKAGCLNLFNEPRELTLGYPEPQRRFYISILRFL